MQSLKSDRPSDSRARGKYSQFVATLPANFSSLDARGAYLRELKAMMEKKISVKRRDKNFWENQIKNKHWGSPVLLREVWRETYIDQKKKIRPKVLAKELSGRVIGKCHMSPHVVEGIARREANLAIGRADESLVIKSPRGPVRDLYLSWDDDKIKEFCDVRATECWRLYRNSPMPGWEIREVVREYGFELPVIKIGGVVCLEGALQRVITEKWWRRRVRALKAERVDELARALRLVSARGQTYCSNELHRIKRSQRARNRSILESLEAKNDAGDVYSLQELADLSPSNPSIRISELMVRARGFENLADGFGHQGVFLTLTAPSAFHPMRQIKKSNGELLRVVPNEKWIGATVREAQNWMNHKWSLIRSAWARRGIECYGFRVVEPHHDGCPHWHALLFFEKDDAVIKEAVRIIKQKMFKEYANEKGAKKHRVKVVMIDKSKGSATGYIAKYIAKNINGSHLEEDLFGNDARSASERICDWAAGHRVRQFQQIGGPSVSVWRELRRMDNAEGYVEYARQAADSADWEAYCLMQGGPFVKSRLQPIRLGRWVEERVNAETGEIVQLDKEINLYGEPVPGVVYGVEAFGDNFLSRFYRWEIGNAAKSWWNTFKKRQQKIAGWVAKEFLYPGGFSDLLGKKSDVVVSSAGELSSDDVDDFQRSLDEGLSLDDIPVWGG